MRKAISNIIIAVFIFLRWILDFLGWLMDMIGIPDAANTIQELFQTTGGNTDYLALMFWSGIIFLFLINFNSLKNFALPNFGASVTRGNQAQNGKEQLRLVEAANLWVGEDPKHPNPTTKSRLIFDKLHRARISGDLKTTETHVGVQTYYYVTISELQRYAESIDERPSFLYPMSHLDSYQRQNNGNR